MPGRAPARARLPRGYVVLSVGLSGLLASCASTVAPPSTTRPPGVRPRSVTVTLTESVRYEPHSPDKKSEPGMRDVIAECERSRSRHCGDRAIAGETRSRFVRGEDERVHLFVGIRGLEGGRAYELRARWFGPDGGMVARVTDTLYTPVNLHRNVVYHVRFSAVVNLLPAGLCRVELSIDGEVEAERVFEVVTSASPAA